LRQKSGQKIVLFHSPHGPRAVKAAFNYDRITDAQGDPLNATSAAVPVDGRPIYFHNVTV
jgi:hypothetical protein